MVRLDRAWTTWRGERLRILAAEAVDAETGAGRLAPGVRRDTLVGTGDGVLRILVVQPAGRRPMDADAWSRGVRVDEDEPLGADGDVR